MKSLTPNRIKSGNYQGSYVFEPDTSPIEKVDKLPGGIYKIEDIGGMFSTKIIYEPIKNMEKYIDFSGGTVAKVMNKAKLFFSQHIKDKYEELGIAHKTGILLYGKPGTGKTVTAKVIMNKLVKEYEAICLVINNRANPGLWKEALKELNNCNRPIVFFLDECEDSLSEYESAWLTFLDGHESISNFMFIGCTNYIDRISRRMKRPSRIEHLIEVDCIEEEVANQYVHEKVSKLTKEVKAAMVYFAMEKKATIDAFKNAVKEYYIYSDTSNPDAFGPILQEYIREDSSN